ncbi:hypothetical protein [Moraxella lacunata]|uniref:hypothetical protein n=1 Tax=Moraxella lacunata TaxID=477 RepID=UPI003EE131B4
MKLSIFHLTPNKLNIYHRLCRDWLRTSFDNMPIFIGVHSMPLHPNFFMFVVILKFLGCIL